MSQITKEYKEFRKSFSYNQEISLKTLRGFWSMKMMFGFMLVIIAQIYFTFWFSSNAPANLWLYMFWFILWIVQFWVLLMFIAFLFALVVTFIYAYELDRRAKLEALKQGIVVSKKKPVEE